MIGDSPLGSPLFFEFHVNLRGLLLQTLNHMEPMEHPNDVVSNLGVPLLLKVWLLVDFQEVDHDS